MTPIQFCKTDDDVVETFVLMNNGSSLIYSLNKNAEVKQNLGYNEYRLQDSYTPKLLYQPPKAKQLVQISKSPFEENAYYVLTSDSDLLVYQIENNVAKILYSYAWNEIKVIIENISLISRIMTEKILILNL